jgi:hypothetical protein
MGRRKACATIEKQLGNLRKQAACFKPAVKRFLAMKPPLAVILSVQLSKDWRMMVDRLKFPVLNGEPEPPLKKLTSEEYLRFCEFCLRNNPRLREVDPLLRKTGKEEIKEPFHF